MNKTPNITFIRGEHDSKFTCIENESFINSSLSLQAMGLLTRLLMLPDNWHLDKYKVHLLVKAGREASIKAFNELEKAGHIFKEPIREKNNMLRGWRYIICETPHVYTALPETRSTETPSCKRKYYRTNKENLTKESDRIKIPSLVLIEMKGIHDACKEYNTDDNFKSVP